VAPVKIVDFGEGDTTGCVRVGKNKPETKEHDFLKKTARKVNARQKGVARLAAGPAEISLHSLRDRA
jgi:hypothetical protein